ncbi:unnamed protein product [Nippostrongylus brasiliensis]|uniref:Secreted protein n=1 Tax=Nippostrongylus brasiliensis TaxID=27835 RepID=A0A0N4Y143_NIPBR|nr:unnamed protein product [Nippostrongylus brasiliensis]
MKLLFLLIDGWLVSDISGWAAVVGRCVVVDWRRARHESKFGSWLELATSWRLQSGLATRPLYTVSGRERFHGRVKFEFTDRFQPPLWENSRPAA